MSTEANNSNYTMQKLNQHLYQLTLPTPFNVGDVNVYLLVGDKVTLIDTGVHTEEAWELMRKGLSSIGLEVKDISQILLTHHHLDHIGQVNRIREIAGCQVIAHPVAKPFLLHQDTFVTTIRRLKRELYLSHGVPEEDINKYLRLSPTVISVEPDLYLNEGDSLPGHPEWKVIETFGHAMGHISLYHEKEKLMIAGDHLIKHISANAIVEYIQRNGEYERTRSLPLYRQMLLKCLDLTINIAYSGHGEAITDVSALIKRQLDKQDSRAQKIYETILKGNRTTYDIIQTLFPTKYKTQFSLVFSEVLGHLDLLEEQNRIMPDIVDKMVYYRPDI